MKGACNPPACLTVSLGNWDEEVLGYLRNPPHMHWITGSKRLQWHQEPASNQLHFLAMSSCWPFKIWNSEGYVTLSYWILVSSSFCALWHFDSPIHFPSKLALFNHLTWGDPSPNKSSLAHQCPGPNRCSKNDQVMFQWCLLKQGFHECYALYQQSSVFFSCFTCCPPEYLVSPMASNEASVSPDFSKTFSTFK